MSFLKLGRVCRAVGPAVLTQTANQHTKHRKSSRLQASSSPVLDIVDHSETHPLRFVAADGAQQVLAPQAETKPTTPLCVKWLCEILSTKIDTSVSTFACVCVCVSLAVYAYLYTLCLTYAVSTVSQLVCVRPYAHMCTSIHRPLTCWKAHKGMLALLHEPASPKT